MSIDELSLIPKLSIVVATYQRPDHLANLLKALREQTASPADFEIIVVDNDNQPNPHVHPIPGTGPTIYSPCTGWPKQCP